MSGLNLSWRSSNDGGYFDQEKQTVQFDSSGEPLDIIEGDNDYDDRTLGSQNSQLQHCDKR